MSAQPAILAAVPAHASFLFLDLRHGHDPRQGLAQLARQAHGLTIGLGPTLLAALGAQVEGLRPHPSPVAAGVAMPHTPSDAFVRIAGADPGDVLHRERALLSGCSGWQVADRVSGFMFGQSRDLSGYEDGTENPTGDDAARVALQSGRGPGLDYSSVVAVQRWVHDLDTFGAMDPAEHDAIFGRARISNDELDDAPDSAHVKRTAQEDFDPEAFLVRRSMPWSDHRGAGLVFVSFSATADPFEAQLRRMMGLDDGIVDALFSFTRPVSAAMFWCPPVRDGELDLRGVASRQGPQHHE